MIQYEQPISETDYRKFVNSVTSKTSRDEQAFQDRMSDLCYSFDMKEFPRLLTGAIGLADESAELLELFGPVIFDTSSIDDLDHVHIRKELGDIRFYYEQLAMALDSPCSDHPDQNFPESHKPTKYNKPVEKSTVRSIFRLVVASGEMLGMVKKISFHGKPLNQENISKMTGIMLDISLILDGIYHELSLTDDDVRQNNYEKLSQRYDSGVFEVSKSENRKEGDV